MSGSWAARASRPWASPAPGRSGCGRASGPSTAGPAAPCWRPPVRRATTAPDREVWRLLPDGRRQPLLASAFAVTDEHGGVEVVHSLRDITRLKEADEAKTLFLATASHELKTPVTVIAGFAETILRYPDMPEERRAEAVEAIRRRALELSSIVDRLLLSSKIEGGRVHVDLHPVDVRALVIERGNAFQDATDRHVVLQVAHEVLVASADPLALRTVIDHLLDNAVKYSDGGPVVLAGRRDGDSVQCVRERHRHRHGRGAGPPLLRQVLAGRVHRRAPLRRHRDRPVHRVLHGRRHGRHHQRRDRRRPGQHVHRRACPPPARSRSPRMPTSWPS